MSLAIVDNDPKYVVSECRHGSDVNIYFDRSALYTLAHNIQVGAALVASFDAGWASCELAVAHLDDHGWWPNVDGKEMPR